MGGGVVIYIRNCIPYIFRTDLNPENAEAVCLEIKKRKVKPLLVSTRYRPLMQIANSLLILKIS